jgi:NAD(P)-dependent dehydrogenase (short-subunit alcohol dehydrogenase family)
MNVSHRDGAVVVTGASSGIGRATALHLDRLGLHVFAGVRRLQDANALRTACSGRLTPIHLDITSPGDVAAAAARVAEMPHLRLLAIVNCAGIAVAGPVEFVPLEAWRQQFEVNVLGLVAMVQAFTPLLRQSRGRVIVVGSVAGSLSRPILGPYCASKHATEAICDSLRLELSPWGIRVVLFQPGAIASATSVWEDGLRRADAWLASAAPDVRQVYADVLAKKRSARRHPLAAEPYRVAQAIGRALLAPKPRARYPMGIEARAIIVLSRVLPDRWKDGLLLKLSGLSHDAISGAARGR